MSEGRKTRRFKETNDKAELDRQWKKISAVSARYRGIICLRESFHLVLPSLSWARLCGPGHVLAGRVWGVQQVGLFLEAEFAPCESVGQIFGASGLQRQLELRPREQS